MNQIPPPPRRFTNIFWRWLFFLSNYANVAAAAVLLGGLLFASTILANVALLYRDWGRCEQAYGYVDLLERSYQHKVYQAHIIESTGDLRSVPIAPRFSEKLYRNSFNTSNRITVWYHKEGGYAYVSAGEPLWWIGIFLCLPFILIPIAIFRSHLPAHREQLYLLQLGMVATATLESSREIAKVRDERYSNSPWRRTFQCKYIFTTALDESATILRQVVVSDAPNKDAATLPEPEIPVLYNLREANKHIVPVDKFSNQSIFLDNGQIRIYSKTALLLLLGLSGFVLWLWSHFVQSYSLID